MSRVLICLKLCCYWSLVFGLMSIRVSHNQFIRHSSTFAATTEKLHLFFLRKINRKIIALVLVSKWIGTRQKETNAFIFSYKYRLKWTLLCRGERLLDTEIIQPCSFCQFNYFLLRLVLTKPSVIDSPGDDVLCYLWNRYKEQQCF